MMADNVLMAKFPKTAEIVEKLINRTYPQ